MAVEHETSEEVNLNVYAFHPKYFKRLGVWRGMDMLDKDTIRITYAPYTERQIKAKRIKPGLLRRETIVKLEKPVTIEVPVKSYDVINGIHIIFMHPLTQEIWLTPHDFARIRDLTSYSEVKNQLKAYEDAVYLYKEAVNEKDDLIGSLESRVAKIEGHTALLQAETDMFNSAVVSIRNQMADAENRLSHFKAKMESAVILHQDASEMLRQFPELFKFAQSMVLATKAITDQMQDTLIHKRSRSIEEIKQKQEIYEHKLKQIEQYYHEVSNKIFSDMDRRIAESKQNEPAGATTGAGEGGAGGGAAATRRASPTFARESAIPAEGTGEETTGKGTEPA